LHRAVRNTDTLEQHGFLNVLLAVRDALAGEPVTAIAGTLAERDRTVIADAVRALAPSAIEEIRFSFISFGTCSTDEPVADLVGLGLLSPS
jgi:hypothetical protein